MSDRPHLFIAIRVSAMQMDDDDEVDYHRHALGYFSTKDKAVDAVMFAVYGPDVPDNAAWQGFGYEIAEIVPDEHQPDFGRYCATEHWNGPLDKKSEAVVTWQRGKRKLGYCSQRGYDWKSYTLRAYGQNRAGALAALAILRDYVTRGEWNPNNYLPGQFTWYNRDGTVEPGSVDDVVSA